MLKNMDNSGRLGRKTKRMMDGRSWLGYLMAALSCAFFCGVAGVRLRLSGQAFARHPSQLYAAALEGLLTFAFVQWRFWKSDVTKKYPGRLSGEFLIFYGLARIANECFREPDASLIMGISRGQFYSIFLILAGLLLIKAAHRINSHPIKNK